MALTVIDSSTIYTGVFEAPDVLRISGTNVYIIVYRGEGFDGFIQTVSIGSAGNIDSSIDTFEFDTDNCRYPYIIHISGDIYAIVYSGKDNDGWLATVEIDSAGNITDPVVDSHEFDGAHCVYPCIIHISGTTYAIAYAGPDSDGWLRTITIANDGTIAAVPEIDNLEFDTRSGTWTDITHVYGDIYAISHTGHDAITGYDTRIETIDIDSAGNIGAAVIDTLAIQPAGSSISCGSGRLAHVVGDIYALSLQNVNASLVNAVYIYTFDIDTTGSIGAVVDSLELATGYLTPDLLCLSPRYYAVAYRGTDFDGFLKIVIIGRDGTIGGVVDTLEFDEVYIDTSPYITIITPRVIAIAYEDNTGGALKTISGLPAVHKGNPNIDQLIYQHAERMEV